MKPFAIDLDDVLARFADAIHRSLCNRYPNIKPVAQWNTFLWSDINGVPYEDFVQAMIDDGLLTSCVPVPGAVTAMQIIHASGFPIVIITARGYHPDAYALTHAWLTLHGIPFDDLIIVPKGQTKAQAAQHKYPKGFIYMIDDNAENLDHMREAGLVSNPILIDQPWNQDRRDFKVGSSRFKTISDFVFSLKNAAHREASAPFERNYSMVN
jgi:FMN phosphatase YigB (HAD superfamily)